MFIILYTIAREILTCKELQDSPLQIFSVDGFVADGALPPGVVGEGEVVQNARPAENVAAPGDLGGGRWVEAEKKTMFSFSVLANKTQWLAEQLGLMNRGTTTLS